MIQVTNIDKIIPEKLLAGLSKEEIQTVLEEIGSAAHDYWVMKAAQIKSSFRMDYMKGIQELKMEPGRAVVALVGAVPHMLEDGSPETDLRDILLGDNVPVAPFGQKGKRESADGEYYRAIPFRHTTPGTEDNPRGATLGQEMGSAYEKMLGEDEAKKLGQDVYKEAIQLEGSISKPGGGVAYGERLEEGLAPKLKSHHKTDIYAGMIKNQKTYENAVQSTYITFRTISTGVRTGWIRRAIPARHIAKDVGQYVARIAPKAFAAAVRSKT